MDEGQRQKGETAHEKSPKGLIEQRNLDGGEILSAKLLLLD